MAPKKTSTPPVLNINLAELRRALNVVLRFASTDPTLPMINAVRWETDGKRLIFTATDRYTVGRYAMPLGPLEDGQKPPQFQPTQIRVTDLLKLLGFFKPQRGLPTKTVGLTLGERWEFADSDVRFLVTPSDLNMPPFEKLFRDAIAAAKKAEPTSHRLALDAAKVAQFSTGMRGANPAVFWPAQPNKVVLVTVTDEFMGLIMPVRISRAHDEQLSMIEADLGLTDLAVAS